MTFGLLIKILNRPNDRCRLGSQQGLFVYRVARLLGNRRSLKELHITRSVILGGALAPTRLWAQPRVHRSAVGPSRGRDVTIHRRWGGSRGAMSSSPSMGVILRRGRRRWRRVVRSRQVAERHHQGSTYRPLTDNRRPPVPVYRTGLAGYRSEPDKFKFKFKLPRSTGSYRYTGRLDRFTGRFGRVYRPV